MIILATVKSLLRTKILQNKKWIFLSQKLFDQIEMKQIIKVLA